MKKIILATAISLSFISCGGKEIVYVDSADTVPVEESAQTTAAPTTTQPPATRPTLPPPDEEPAMNGYQPDVYLDIVRKHIPYWYYNYSDENLLNLGIVICDEIDAGTPIDRLLIEVMTMALDIDPELNENVGLFMRYVVRYICPENFWQIEALNS